MVDIFKTSVFGVNYPDVWEGNPEYEQYEEEVRRRVEEEFSPDAYTIRSRRLFEFEDGAEICPDIVVLLKHNEGEEYACVADAKHRARLEKRHVLKMVMYRQRLSAHEARLYVPSECKIQSGARVLADAEGIRIVSDLEQFGF